MTDAEFETLIEALIVPAPQSVLSQDLIAQSTDDDAAKIQVAVAGNAQLWLIWSAMLAQRDPMVASNAPSSRMGGAGTGARTTPHEHDRHRVRPYHVGVNHKFRVIGGRSLWSA
jgi:hypothetical protein